MKRVLLIDDSDVSSTLDSVKSEFEEGEVEIFSFNPNKPEFEKDGQLDVANILEVLKNSYFPKRINVVGCDFNLHETEKILAIKIINGIREFDKCCSILLYSGGIGKFLHENFSEDKRNGDRLFKTALSSGINRILPGRTGVLKTNIVEMLNTPTPQLQILEFLEDLDDREFIDNATILGNKKVQDVIREIRFQNSEGAEYTKEIIEQALSVMLKVNIN